MAADPNRSKKAGYHRFWNPEERVHYGSFVVEWLEGFDGQDPRGPDVTDQLDEFEPGWYWAACFPGCMPDSDWNGPFDTSNQAWKDARE